LRGLFAQARYLTRFTKKEKNKKKRFLSHLNKKKKKFIYTNSKKGLFINIEKSLSNLRKKIEI